ncbi:hypothetical protein Hypma_008333 [Hypsizygus marmoreus]|uniref:Uncharacterized protein n=1 Tax=Hypsizygus marmoreus TaxID=39966 RepID=A0A369JVX2_HYPMA|nr:hypothetical protein Hypma_008333 [Hypsizygus marmoreus]
MHTGSRRCSSQSINVAVSKPQPYDLQLLVAFLPTFTHGGHPRLSEIVAAQVIMTVKLYSNDPPHLKMLALISYFPIHSTRHSSG